MPFSLTSNEVRGPLRWWYNIGAPSDVPEDAPLKKRERVRIGKLTSLALLIELLQMGIAGYSALEDPNKWLPFIYLSIVFTLIIALILNRYSQIRLAGLLVLFSLEVGIAMTILGIPQQELSSFHLPLFALYIQPLLIAASLLPIWFVLPLTLYHIVCICLALTFMAKTPELLAHMQAMPYTTYGIPIGLQVISALIALIWISATYEEIRRAEMAEEVNRLTQQLARQVAQASYRYEELERNIEAIRFTLANVSNGNYQIQVPLTPQDILWPIALSLNTLLNRTRSFREQGIRFTQLNSLLGELSKELHQYRTGQKLIQLPPNNTGTAFDLLVIELRAWLATAGTGPDTGIHINKTSTGNLVTETERPSRPGSGFNNLR